MDGALPAHRHPCDRINAGRCRGRAAAQDRGEGRVRHFAAHVPVATTARAEALTSVETLFQYGMDTEQIARLQWRTEASVLREINVARSMRLRRLSPYEARP